MVGLASSSTDATVPELPVGDDTEPVVKLPAHAGEVPMERLSLDEEMACKDTVTKETEGADLVGVLLDLTTGLELTASTDCFETFEQYYGWYLSNGNAGTVNHIQLSRRYLLITRVGTGKHPDHPRCSTWERDSPFDQPGCSEANLNSTSVSTQWRSNNSATHWGKSLSPVILLKP